MESSHHSKSVQGLIDAVNSTDIEELRKTLPPDKKLTEGRQYLVRKSKRRAPYWEYFIEYLDNERLRAECKFCPSTFAADGNLNGSKNVSKHSDKCLGNPVNKEKGKGKQTELYFQPGEGDKDNEDGDMRLKYGSVNLKEVRDALTYMIIVDELPFRFVEKAGFKHFVSVSCPRFNIPSRSTVARDCLQLYHDEKSKLKDKLMNCQTICVTTDTWTSIQRINYMCLTAHYIDSDWKLHKKIINFCPISSHKGEAIGKAVEACMEVWGIEDKLFTVTVDNASSNDVACAHLRRMSQRTGCVGDGKFIHVRCVAHIINLIVWDGIKEHGVCIDRVRNAVKFVKNSPARIQRFKDLAQKANIDSKSSLCLDVSTRWNSTYLMLDTALKFQRVFNSISLPDGDGLKDNERPPELDDWKKVESLVVFLKGFYLLTRRISGSLYVTSNRGLFDIAKIFNMLNKFGESLDENFKAMAISMKNKFEKYWGDVDKMNKLIYVAALLDPRSKFEVIGLTLSDMYGKEKGIELANDVRDVCYSLFDDYRRKYAPQTGQTQSEGVDDMTIDSNEDINEEGGDDYVRSLMDRAKRMKGTSGYVRSEFERYINEQLGVEEESTDALTWWSRNEHRYPILSRMARDILAIPLSTVASESAFSAGGRHLDPFRSSLTPKTVQALICTQDWLRGKEKSGIDMEENLRELEEIEKEFQATTLDQGEDVVYVDSFI